MKEYFVYILRCSDNSYYTGITNNVDRRFQEHQTGFDPRCYTFERRPLKLAYSTSFNDVWDAINFEKQVKGWSRKKKEALIRGDEKALKWFAKRSGVQKKAALAGGSRLSSLRAESTSP